MEVSSILAMTTRPAPCGSPAATIASAMRGSSASPGSDFVDKSLDEFLNSAWRGQRQCPAGSRKIPGSRDWTSIPIPGFLKIQSRDFSGFGYSTEDDVYKDFYMFSDSKWVFFILPEPFIVLKIFALQTLTDFFIE